MDRTVHAPAAEQRSVGGVHDCINVERRDIGPNGEECGWQHFSRSSRCIVPSFGDDQNVRSTLSRERQCCPHSGRIAARPAGRQFAPGRYWSKQSFKGDWEMTTRITLGTVVALTALLSVGGPPPGSAAPDPTAAAANATAALIGRLGLEESATPVREIAGWVPPRRILVWNRAPGLLPALQAAAPGVELVPASSDAEAAKLARDVDAAIGFCSEEVLSAGPRIRWVQVFWAGVEDCVAVPGLRERKVLLTNMQRVAGPVMAEHVVAMMFAFARGLQFYIPERMAARWTEEVPAPGKMLTLDGKTVLVVGLGGIGTEVARRAHALGMRVIATRASGREGPEFVSYVGLPEELLKLAAEADFIVNTTPLTPATTGIFDAKFFAAAKPGAYFFNVGRGGSVVQQDLVAALKSGRLAGAGLDVTDPEPLPASSPLWKLQNVIITPHVSADSDLGHEARFLVASENLRRYVAGERMLSVVDVAKGY
jgi:phosphoglycerate dehydrogenase-like enzyme